jgi:uncharacterized protein YjiK
MTMTIRRFIVAAAALAACGEPPGVEAQPAGSGASLFATSVAQQWRLPNRLREISGLAVSADGRVFAHDDERAVIYEIDAGRGALVKAFAVGDPIALGDFEGLAIAPDGVFWMTTSEGRLYRFEEGADGAQVPYETFDTGLRTVCEIEGLAYLAAEESLILACKQNHDRSMRDRISLYLWRFAGEAVPWRELREAELTAAAGVRRFRPSSLDVDPASGRLLLLSARDAALAELGPDGALLAARALHPSHVQAEGVAALPDGSLVIADEGGRGRALLSRYDRIP